MSLVNHPAEEGSHIITALAHMLGAPEILSGSSQFACFIACAIKQLKYTVRIRRAFSDQKC